MAEPSVTQWNSEDHAVEGVDWEEQSYLEGCASRCDVVYLDESGNPGSFRNNQDHFVIGGIAVHEGQIRQLSDRLDAIESRFFPDISIPLKFHATDINSGRGGGF